MAGEKGADVGIESVAYWLPPRSVSLAELAAGGNLESPPEVLAALGFECARVGDENHVEMALRAARDLLREARVEPDEIDLVLYAGGLASSSLMADGASPPGALLHVSDLMDFFKYPVARIQSELELTRAAVAGVDQQGCAAVFSAIRIGRDMLLAEDDLRTVLCVAADKLPAGSSREIFYNVISDGACAVLLRKPATANRIVAFHQVTKGAFWDAEPLKNEVIATYFPTARVVIEQTLRKAGLTNEDIAWILPHNVSYRSWEILLGLLGFPRERLFSENIARFGHTIAADNFINLRDATEGGRIRPGEHLLLFTFGFGLNWSCMILQH